MIEKRGLGHIEIILSFVLFIVALAFALIFFNPANSDSLVETSMDYVFSEIEKNTESELEVVEIKINSDEIGENTNILGFKISGMSEELKSEVETLEGIKLNSHREGDIVYVSTEDWKTIDFIKIMFSDEFKEESFGEGDFDENYYDISSSEKKKVISEKKILELSRRYLENYEGLREEFNLPNRVNFGYRLVFSDGESIRGLREIPGNLDSFVESKRVEILNEEGEVIFAKLEVIIW